MKNAFLTEMQSRGYLNQCTDLVKLEDICNKKQISAYIGFDCTASSLHVGSLLQIMVLKLLQKHGASSNYSIRRYNSNWRSIRKR